MGSVCIFILIIHQHNQTNLDYIRARCTSAAPWFFKPMSITGVGTFQDGGLNHNNPVFIATSEARYLYPNCQLDMLVSAGTGTASFKTRSEFASDYIPTGSPVSPSGFWNHRFLARIYRSFMNSMDGEKTWSQFFNYLPQDADRYIRLNIELTKEPELDDTAMMPDLAQATIDGLSKSVLCAVREYIYATCFYFELDELPILDKDKTGFNCSGKIYCRYGTDDATYITLVKYLSEDLASFLVSGRAIIHSTTELNIATGQYMFCRLLRFYIQSLEDEFSILLLCSPNSRPVNISGSPFSVNRLISQQGLDEAFGVWNLKRKLSGSRSDCR